jgi:hypothetical protein
MNLLGDVIDIYDVIQGFTHGQLSYAAFINDSLLAASAGWGNSDLDIKTKAVTIDTLGNLLNSYVLMNDIYTSILQVTYDGKLAYFTNTEQNGQFDVYLQKLNQNLEDDTIYTDPFQYDTLCPYPIVSDTIVQDDCELIVGFPELPKKEEKPKVMKIFPNPAGNRFQVASSMLQVSSCIIEVFDLFGRKVKEIRVPKGQNDVEVDVEGESKRNKSSQRAERC